MTPAPITRGRDLGPALAKLLGFDLDQHRVCRIVIVWRADGAPLIRVTEYATIDQERAVLAAALEDA